MATSKPTFLDTWVVWLVKHPALDFGSGYDLRVVRQATHWAWNLFKILFLPPSAPPLPHLSLLKKKRQKTNTAKNTTFLYLP